MTPGSIRVLVVEDNPGDARLLKEALLEGGGSTFEVIHDTRLGNALQRLGAERIDVVLLDLGLPDGQGLETFVQAHERAAGVPIVVLTGLDDETIAIRAMQAGAQDYLVKGHVDAHAVSRSIRYAIERQKMQEFRVLSDRLDRGRAIQTDHIWKALYQTLGRGAAAILYQAGIQGGATTYDFIMEAWKPVGEASLVKALRDYLASANIGVCLDVKVDRSGKMLALRARDTFEARFHGSSATAVCHFLRGTLCGFAGRLVDDPNLIGEETNCQAMGGADCEFLIHSSS